MSLCSKCNELIQSAATKSVMKKKKELEKSGYDESSFGKILTDPFVVMWVPEPEKPPPSQPKYFDPDPCCIEYDVTIDLNTCKQQWSRRRYPIFARKPKEDEIQMPPKIETGGGGGSEGLPPLNPPRTRRNADPCVKKEAQPEA